MVWRRRSLNIHILLVLVVLLSSLSVSTAQANASQPRFPRGFLFGTAIAGFQNDMGCPTLPPAVCADPNSDWYVWTQTPALTAEPDLHLSGEPISDGPGFFELYPDDLKRAADRLSSNSIRLSIEWSRIFPTPTFGVEDRAGLQAIASPAGLAYYHALFRAIRAHGMTPLVTLNHYTLPSWMHDAYTCHFDFNACQARGWADSRIVHEIAKYAGFVANEFGGEVDHWITLNEPTIVAITGYLFPAPNRVAPPGLALQADLAKLVLANMVQANAAMYEAVHALDRVNTQGDGSPAEVGVVMNIVPAQPHNPTNPYDVSAAKNYVYLTSGLLLNAFARGDLDPGFNGQTVHVPSLEHHMDFLGVNYYSYATVTGYPFSVMPGLSPLLNFNPGAVVSDYNRSEGIYEALEFGRQYGLPMLVTETGRTDPLDDGTAPRWIVETLQWVQRAINGGAPVEGYYYWTLTDNYDWNQGMSIRMGLFGVDANKARFPRKGVRVFQQIAAGGEIPAALRNLYPIE